MNLRLGILNLGMLTSLGNKEHLKRIHYWTTPSGLENCYCQPIFGSCYRLGSTDPQVHSKL